MLITPHGDRKRSAPAPRTEGRPPHYPSWGSETSRTTAWPVTSKCVSLPLMGIGNAQVPKLAARGVVLITPHGDRKRRDARQRQRELLRAHYPSWGSETVRRDAEARSKGDLLITPHGDRKPRLSRLAARTAGALITPHGDRKPAKQRRAAEKANLITPHGDRKLYRKDVLWHPQLVLITPHGDRKHRRAAVAGAASGSLPLMGIGNVRMTRFERGQRAGPHYPSWGSET